MSRAETTAMLSKLVEKRLRNQTAFWASEVNFDRNTPDERRVDYVGFKPWNINGEPVPASVEKGCFEFYEVKSCMADFTSGNGLTFYGDSNFLVCTKELCDEIVWRKMVPPRVNAILTPDSTGSKLILDYVQSYNDLSYRGVRQAKSCGPWSKQTERGLIEHHAGRGASLRKFTRLRLLPDHRRSLHGRRRGLRSLLRWT